MVKRILVGLGLAVFAILIPLYPQTGLPTEIISVVKTPGAVDSLRALGLDLLLERHGRIYALAGPEELGLLRQRNILYLVETPGFPKADRSDARTLGSLNGDFHSYAELERDLKTLEKSFPSLVKLFEIGTSLENRKIYAVKISDNVSLNENEAEVLFLGCHHAREWISVEVPYFLAKHLAENYATGAEIRKIVDRSEIWIVPLVNPDGLEYSIHYYRYWRKNRRSNADGSYGVDLNRNYGFNWGLDNTGSSPNPSSAVYRGTGPFSEPETKAVRDLFLQKKFQAMITFHSYSQIILYPWGYTTQSSDKDGLLSRIAAGMSQLMRAVNGRLYQYGRAGASLYLTNGDTTDWTFGTSGIPSYTIELPPVDQLQGGFFNAEADILPIFRENLPAMLYLLDWSIQNRGLNVTVPEDKDVPADSRRAGKSQKKN